MRGRGEPFVRQPCEDKYTAAAEQRCCNHQQHALESTPHRGSSQHSTAFLQPQTMQIPRPPGAGGVTHQRGGGRAEARVERCEQLSVETLRVRLNAIACKSARSVAGMSTGCRRWGSLSWSVSFERALAKELNVAARARFTACFK